MKTTTDDDDDNSQQPAPNPGTGGTGGSALPFVVYLGMAGGGTGVGGALGDILSGLDGADALFGMGGDDSLVGHGGNDNLVAGDGNDLVFGDDGNDTVLAGAGDDTVFGGNGNDTIWADGGNDRITGGEGNDVIDAGDGNDTIYASLNDGNDVITGGAGTDTIDYQAITAALTINLGATGSGSASSAQSGTDALNGIENVKGGSGNDTIYASNAAQRARRRIGRRYVRVQLGRCRQWRPDRRLYAGRHDRPDVIHAGACGRHLRGQQRDVQPGGAGQARVRG